MCSHPELRIDWCDIKAARYAVMHWHYSHALPCGKLVKVGVWEDGKFIGCVLFGRGANNVLGSPYGLGCTEVCELVRVALATHQTPVTRIVAIAIRFLMHSSPGLRLIVSFADPSQGHHGGIYQGGGWIFNGASNPADEYIYQGKRYQGRGFRSQHKGMEHAAGVEIVKGSSKLRYLMPLDDAMRAQIAPLAKPYPKRAKEQDAEHPSALGGVTPTRTLQHREHNVPQPA